MDFTVPKNTRNYTQYPGSPRGCGPACLVFTEKLMLSEAAAWAALASYERKEGQSPGIQRQEGQSEPCLGQTQL